MGVFLFVYGEYDDSPGGQLLGLVMIVIGIVGLIKKKWNYRCQTSVKFYCSGHWAAIVV